MSTDYQPLRPVRLTDLFDGRLKQFGVTEHVCDGTTDTRRCLTDGHNRVWAYASEGGFAVFTRSRRNGPPGRILAAVEAAFDTVIASEYLLYEWFSEIIDEKDAAEEARRYEDMMKYVRGEVSDLRLEPGSSGELWAKHAKILIAKYPELALQKNKTALLDAVRTAFDHEGGPCRRSAERGP